MAIKCNLNLSNESKLKILHLLTISLPKLAGYSIRTHNILKYQSDYCFPFALTEPDFLPKKTPDIIDNIIYYRHPPTSAYNCFFNQRIKKMTRKLKINKWYYRTLFRKNLFFLKKLLNFYPADIIHVQSSTFYGTFGGLIAKKLKIPFIFEVRGFVEDTHIGLGILKEGSFQYNNRKRARLKIIKKADVIVTLSYPMKKELISQGIEDNKIKIIPNGVNIEKFLPKSQYISLKHKLGLKNEKILGYIGSIRRIEGIEILLQAIKIIKQKVKDITLLIIDPGDPIYIKELRTITEKLDIKNNIKFIGSVPNNEIDDYYSIVDICIIPRLNLRVNQFVTPLKPLEAMAMGKLLITSDLPALRELVKPKISGELFEAENYKELAEKLLFYLNNQEMINKIGKKARDYVVTHYSWNNIIKKYLSLYNSLTN